MTTNPVDAIDFGPESFLAYGCVRCQQWHHEGDALFERHIMHQSKHGITRKTRKPGCGCKFAGTGEDMCPEAARLFAAATEVYQRFWRAVDEHVETAHAGKEVMDHRAVLWTEYDRAAKAYQTHVEAYRAHVEASNE